MSRRLAVIVPSRSRPESIEDLERCWDDKTDRGIAELIVAIDNDDPQAENYLAFGAGHRTVVSDRMRMIGTLNHVAAQYADEYFALGFMGDDHRPRTHGWESIVLQALDDLGTGIVYGNDLIHGENLPTAVFMTSDIVRALGYMAPPTLWHLFADNTWLAWGREAHCIRYIPSLTIEHFHPIAGKAEMDEGYARVNSGEMYQHDENAFHNYVDDQLQADVEKIRRLRDGTN